MKNTSQKKLSFEPLYHRRISRGKYSAIAMKATKGASMESFKSAITERDKILAQGFTIVEVDIERPFNYLEDPDKGDVVTVLANTNPAFKMSLKTGEQA
jgi:hypothetical protein